VLVEMPMENCSKDWVKFFSGLGLPYSFHCLRVTVVTRLARAGISESQAMRYVGHSSTLVHALYRKLRPEDLSGPAGVL
jgi:integrase